MFLPFKKRNGSVFHYRSGTMDAIHMMKNNILVQLIDVLIVVFKVRNLLTERSLLDLHLHIL